MKKLFWLILITLISCQKPYIDLDKKYDDIEYLISRIKPEIKVDKWEFFFNDLGEPKSIFDSNEAIEFSIPIKSEIESKYISGFFSGCMPAYCSYFIAATKGDSIEIIDSEAKLQNFIGKVDNIEEAIIIAKINGFDLSLENRIGKYKITENGFYFKGNKFIKCPQKILKYNIEVSKNGELRSWYQETIEISKDCIIE
ncbi:hypothetical protein [Adhaeribacter terreus]|uniref:Lipoprotein n=1 Tax=Adhaeribacter terreus TaxID=529703 RepID=A0ABW0EAR3_9BACT